MDTQPQSPHNKKQEPILQEAHRLNINPQILLNLGSYSWHRKWWHHYRPIKIPVVRTPVLDWFGQPAGHQDRTTQKLADKYWNGQPKRNTKGSKPFLSPNLGRWPNREQTLAVITEGLSDQATATHLGYTALATLNVATMGSPYIVGTIGDRLSEWSTQHETQSVTPLCVVIADGDKPGVKAAYSLAQKLTTEYLPTVVVHAPHHEDLTTLAHKHPHHKLVKAVWASTIKALTEDDHITEIVKP